MINNFKFLFLLLFFIPKLSIGQSDSVEIYKLNDNYYEIKSLRNVLHFDSSCGLLCSFTYSYIPKSPKIKEGVVLIRDRENNILELHIFMDSVEVLVDEYNSNGKLIRQFFSPEKKDISIDKYYWENGKLRELVIYFGRKQIVYSYYENGELDQSE